MVNGICNRCGRAFRVRMRDALAGFCRSCGKAREVLEFDGDFVRVGRPLMNISATLEVAEKVYRGDRRAGAFHKLLAVARHQGTNYDDIVRRMLNGEPRGSENYLRIKLGFMRAIRSRWFTDRSNPLERRFQEMSQLEIETLERRITAFEQKAM